MNKNEKDKSVIPKGIYCYDEERRCPYWEFHKNDIDEEYGYCHYLEEYDGLLLWDQCKICGINDELEEGDCCEFYY